MKESDETIRRVMDALRRIVRALRLSASETDRRLGISVAQLFVLQKLADGKARSLVELATETLTDPGSVSAVVRRLSERALVRRRAADGDARRAAVSLTDEGRAVLRRAPGTPQAQLVDALVALPARSRRQLAATLEQVVRGLGDVEPSFFFEEQGRPRKR